MSPTIAIVAPGAMGSAVARRLADNGARVLTSLKGRSQASLKRATDAGMIGAEDAEIAAAPIILSIVPPGEALALAERLAGVIARRATKPLVVDCNAVNVDTVRSIEAVIAGAGARFVDGGIIGLPPTPGSAGPRFYVSGDCAGELVGLKRLGIDLRVMDGPVGAASALKMCYAGITKGLCGIGAAMVMAAAHAGASDALRAELAASQPAVLSRLDVALPQMVPKAYRWVAEMREIADFLGPENPARLIYEGFARLFDDIAIDAAGDGAMAEQLELFAAKASEQAS